MCRQDRTRQPTILSYTKRVLNHCVLIPLPSSNLSWRELSVVTPCALPTNFYRHAAVPSAYGSTNGSQLTDDYKLNESYVIFCHFTMATAAVGFRTPWYLSVTMSCDVLVLRTRDAPTVGSDDTQLIPCSLCSARRRRLQS